MRVLIAAAILLALAACETTRTNNDKGITRPTYCMPVDRC